MTQDSVKRKIKKKFGTYSRYAMIGEMDRYELQREFLEAKNPSKAIIEKHSKLCDQLHVEEDPRLIHPDQLKTFNKKIKEFGGVRAFVNKYSKEFSVMSVRQVMNGDRLMKTKKVNRMFDLLGIK